MITRYEDIPKPTIINPPRSFTKPTSLEGVRKNNEWMKQHYQEYLGQWIALNEGELLGANKNSLELYKTIKAAGQLPVALFISLA
jgi:hypothetical protein